MSYANTSGITINFDEWIEEKQKATTEASGLWQRDIDGIRWLDHKFHFSGFMMSPVAIYRGRTLQANTVSFESIDDFILHCESSVGESHIFLYDLWYNVDMPRYFDVPNPDTFDIVFLDRPIEHVTKGWKVRYGQI